MAILPTKDGWLVDIQPGGRGGRRIRKTFRLKETAEKFAREKKNEAERLFVGGASSIDVYQLMSMYLVHYETTHPKGFKSARYRLKKIRSYFEGHNKAVALFGMLDGDAFMAYRRAQGLTIGSVNRDLHDLKRLFSWAAERGILPYSPIAKLKEIKGATVRCRWLTQAEEDLILATCKQHDSALWWSVFVGLCTGFRRGNIVGLRPDDFKNGMVQARLTKSDKPYEVPIDSRLTEYIPLFKQGVIGMANNFDKRFRRVVRKCGLYKGEDHPDDVTIHTLRHTFASRWLQRGVPIYTVSKWLGHSTVRMTEEVYGHLSKQHHIETMRRYDPEARRQSVDSNIIPFPQNASVSECPHGESNSSFRLERDES